MEDILGLSTNILVLIFIVVVVGIVGFMIVGGKLYPLIEKLNPNYSTGITGEQYTNTMNDLWFGLKAIVYIILAFPFVYFLFRLLFKKEQTSVSEGG